LQSSSVLEQFSTVVEKIYDAALDRDAWPTALESIVHFVNGSAASLTFGNTEAADFEALMFHSVGLSPEFLGGFQKYGPIWGVQSGISFWKEGEVRHLPDFLPRDEFENGVFYKELLKPHKQDDFMGLVALRQGSRFATITASTDTSIEPFTSQSVDSMRLLAPHICKSVNIGFAMELKQLNANLFEQTLNTIGSGIYLVQRDGRIMFMNESAEKQIARGIGLTILNNCITPKDQTAAAQFAAAMSENLDEISPQVISIALPDEHGGMLATIMPLNKGMRQNLTNGANPAVFAIFVQNPMSPPPNPGEGFAKLYGLTQAEVRTLMALSMSQGPQDAAEILGISITTIRTHLQHIFTKTNTSGQSELMQLMMRSAAPIAAQ
jgi:DNA-binding CsgD family transcriptional regulator/PAS domain-containing protein